MQLVQRASLLFALCLLISTATAYAEGWYLMAPPWRTSIKEGEDEFDTMASLTRWQQKGAFDTARICENTRLGIIKTLEQDLQVPVVHPVTARVWEFQKRLHVREPRSGYGYMLEALP